MNRQSIDSRNLPYETLLCAYVVHILRQTECGKSSCYADNDKVSFLFCCVMAKIKIGNSQT